MICCNNRKVLLPLQNGLKLWSCDLVAGMFGSGCDKQVSRLTMMILFLWTSLGEWITNSWQIAQLLLSWRKLVVLDWMYWPSITQGAVRKQCKLLPNHLRPQGDRKNYTVILQLLSSLPLVKASYKLTIVIIMMVCKHQSVPLRLC